MEFKLVYWQWLVLGMLMMVAEIFIPSFTIFWFGLGAMTTSILLLLFRDMTLTWQLFSWILASCAYTVLWFKYFKPRMVDKTQAGIAREAVIGQSGQVITVPVEKKRGSVRFSVPLLGADEWEFICQQEISIGDRVFVTDVSGNTLIVEKRD